MTPRYFIALPETVGPHVLWDTATSPWVRVAEGTLAECFAAVPEEDEHSFERLRADAKGDVAGDDRDGRA